MWTTVITVHFVDSLTIRSTFESGFKNTPKISKSKRFEQFKNSYDDHIPIENGGNIDAVLSRRKMVTKTAALVSSSVLPTALGLPEISSAEVGSLLNLQIQMQLLMA